MALTEAERLRLAIELLRDIRRRIKPHPHPQGRTYEESRRSIGHDIGQFLKEIDKH